MVTLTFGELSQGSLGKCGQQDPGSAVAPCSPVMQCLPPHTHPHTSATLHSPRNVVEMYSETWFPDLLISDRCVSSRFSILLN